MDMPFKATKKKTPWERTESGAALHVFLPVGVDIKRL